MGGFVNSTSQLCDRDTVDSAEEVFQFSNPPNFLHIPSAHQVILVSFASVCLECGMKKKSSGKACNGELVVLKMEMCMGGNTLKGCGVTIEPTASRPSLFFFVALQSIVVRSHYIQQSS